MSSTEISALTFPSTMAEADNRWQELAACRGMDTAIFFPNGCGGVLIAKRICERCPVMHLCLLEHIDEPEGIFGGTDATERDRLRGRRSHRRLTAAAR